MVKTSSYHKNLIRRYLIWCYKTTKEELDKTERYFTQLDVDTYVLKQLRAQKDYKRSTKTPSYRALVDQFEEYMAKKKANVIKKKYSDKKQTTLQPHYQYLKNRLLAIEGAIEHFLGRKEQKEIVRLYEEEMTRRILSAREHA